MTKQTYTLEEARLIFDYDKETLSEKSGISISSINSIEIGGMYKTHVGVALALADTLALRIDEIEWPRGLTINGRPPKTGVPLSAHLVIEVQVCESCFMVLPATGICDDCS